ARAALYKELGLFLKTPINRQIRLYILLAFLSTAIGIMMGRAKMVTGFFFVMKYIEYFIVYFMVVNHIQSERQARSFLIAALITAAIVALMAIAQIPAGERITAPFEGKGGEPNTLGGYLLFILSVLLGLFVHTTEEDSFKYKSVLGGMMFLMLVPLLFTQSRGTFTALLPMYITAIIFGRRKTLMIFLLLALFLLAPLLTPQVVIDRLMYTFQKQRGYAATLQEQIGGVTFDTSTSERIRMYRRILRDLPKHPLLGYGVTGWGFVDSQYFRVLIEMGLIGLASYLWLIFALFREGRTLFTTTKNRFHRGIAAGFLTGTVALSVHALGANTFIIVRIMEPYWLLTGIVVRLLQMEQAALGESGGSVIQEGENLLPAKQEPVVQRVS
ncbi:MAG: O-antigen ligase family protein, partial [Candidatus Tectomicrobia bacterium]|nr:O-antigen ligase family protein [Candidatus Tectomicrobia bacterium]